LTYDLNKEKFLSVFPLSRGVISTTMLATNHQALVWHDFKDSSGFDYAVGLSRILPKSGKIQMMLKLFNSHPLVDKGCYDPKRDLMLNMRDAIEKGQTV
jgi:hypothetical protein